MTNAKKTSKNLPKRALKQTPRQTSNQKRNPRSSVKTRKSLTSTTPKAKTAKNRPQTSDRRHDGATTTLSVPQKIILSVIAILIVVIAVATIFALKFDEKYQVEAKITDLAHDYYETYFYPSAFGSDQALATNYLKEYSADGLYPISLRQMILLTPNVSDSDAEFLRKYCNENTTSVTYYPDAPYAQDSYHAEFSYSCEYK